MIVPSSLALFMFMGIFAKYGEFHDISFAGYQDKVAATVGDN
jgi:hypothetical protein